MKDLRNERSANEQLCATYTREDRASWTKPARVRTRPSLLVRIVRRLKGQ